jgi:gliding motility-associated protein GldL
MQSKAWKNFMAKLYGIGAAVVIVGALFKIQHWKGADIMLIIGLGTEAVIFFFSAFEKVHEEIDWTLVYPELAGIPDGDGRAKDKKSVGKGGDSVTQELDKLLSDAKIGPELVESLGKGMRSLAESTSKMTDISDAQLATNDYVTNVKSASQSVEKLAESYLKASTSLTSVVVSNDEGKSYGEQLAVMSKKMGELNSIYDLQLQGSKDYVDSTTKYFAGVNQLMQNLNDSVADTKRYKDEIAQLGSNLEALNTVYGNMLSAMNFRKA